jgi:hypothetical protein
MVSNDARGLAEEELQILVTLLAKFAGIGGDLPWPLVRFVTEVAAMGNVDLLVRDPDLGVLLSWRDDPFGSGWHVPGGIIRHREEIAHRITTHALDEFGCEVQADERPVALIQFSTTAATPSRSVSPHAARRAGQTGLGREREGEAGRPAVVCVPPSNLYPSHLVYDALLRALEREELGTGVKSSLSTLAAGTRHRQLQRVSSLRTCRSPETRKGQDRSRSPGDAGIRRLCIRGSTPSRPRRFETLDEPLPAGGCARYIASN